MEHTMEPTLRKNGMPTKLNRGVIELLADHVVCKEGEHVSPQAAILLRLFGKALATFEIALVCGWVRTPTPRRRLRLHFPPERDATAPFPDTIVRSASAVTTTRCGWLRRLATGKPGTTVLTKSAIHFRSRHFFRTDDAISTRRFRRGDLSPSSRGAFFFGSNARTRRHSPPHR
jgi:hypothetical protein